MLTAVIADNKCSDQDANTCLETASLYARRTPNLVNYLSVICFLLPSCGDSKH